MDQVTERGQITIPEGSQQAAHEALWLLAADNRTLRAERPQALLEAPNLVALLLGAGFAVTTDGDDITALEITSDRGLIELPGLPGAAAGQRHAAGPCDHQVLLAALTPFAGTGGRA